MNVLEAFTAPRGLRGKVNFTILKEDFVFWVKKEHNITLEMGRNGKYQIKENG